MPVFGPIGVRKMFDQQMDIASQMILKWDRLGPKHEILCSDDFTRYVDLNALLHCWLGPKKPASCNESQDQHLHVVLWFTSN